MDQLEKDKDKKEALHDVASHRKRDEHGHFIDDKNAGETSGEGNPTPQVKETDKAAGPLSAISEYFSVEKETGGPEETLIDVKVHNPFTRIMKMLQDIKNHQSTTVSLRFTIPLIALPIVMLAAFQLGKAQTLCATHFTSQTGTLRVVSVLAPKESTDSFGMLLSFFPDIPRLHKKAELAPSMKTILVSDKGDVVNVLHDSTMNLSLYNGIHVILSGMLSPCSGTITLDAPQNLTETGTGAM